MTFVNEYIQKDDFEKYNFAELNRRLKKGGGTRNDWTIDRQADIWLRKFYTESNHTEPDGGYTGVSAWDYYWKGSLMFVEIEDVASGGGYGKPRWSRKKLLSINIPVALEPERTRIIANLVDAFTTYRGAGVLGDDDSPSYSFTLDV